MVAFWEFDALNGNEPQRDPKRYVGLLLGRKRVTSCIDGKNRSMHRGGAGSSSADGKVVLKSLLKTKHVTRHVFAQTVHFVAYIHTYILIYIAPKS